MAIKINVNDMTVSKVGNKKLFYLDKAWDGCLDGVIKMSGTSVKEETFILLIDVFVTQYNSFIKSVDSGMTINKVIKNSENNELEFIFSDGDYCKINW